MQIEKMKLSDLRPAAYNPRIDLEPGMEEFEKLKASIQEFGFVDPPIFNKKTGNLVGGHQRVAVAQYIGAYDEIEVSIVDLSFEKERALNIALNKISGQWDNDKLTSILAELDTSSLELTGFSSFEIENLLSTISEPTALEEFYEEIDQEELDTKKMFHLSWGDQSTTINKDDVQKLDEKLEIYKDIETEETFVQWLLGEGT